MPTVPHTRLGKIEFYESHLDPWAISPAAIGLDPAAVVSLDARTVAARAAYDAHIAARDAALAATQAYYQAIEAMHAQPGAGSDMIETIRAFAGATGDSEVYTLAQIPPPRAPGTPPPPGTPFAFAVNLLENGALSLKWKNRNPRGTGGTLYEVSRQIDDGPFVFVATTGTRAFTDAAVPAGSALVTYEITAARSTARGNPARLSVRLGVEDTGGAASTLLAA
jgi:hypothetical protein